jgi:hypothetical protein
MTRYNILRSTEKPDQFDLMGTVESSGPETAIRQLRETRGLLEEGGIWHSIPVYNWTTIQAEPVVKPSTLFTPLPSPGSRVEEVEVTESPSEAAKKLAATSQGGMTGTAAA